MASSSSNVVQTTWLAYASRNPLTSAAIRRATGRIGVYLDPLTAGPTREEHVLTPHLGLALWTGADPRRRWPLWVETEETTMATSGIPSGWARVTGDVAFAGAPEGLAFTLSRHPERASALDPPISLCVFSRDRAELLMTSDVVGAGRLFEMTAGDITAWSNRLSVLPIFLRVSAQADEEAWGRFAAAGWFLGEGTPVAGARRVPARTVIRASAAGTQRQHSEATLVDLIRPRRSTVRRSSALAAAHAIALVGSVARGWASPLDVALTGGRDSRLSAAAAIAAGADVRFRTGDEVPGELDVVHDLLGRLSVDFEHIVTRPGPQQEPEVGLVERARQMHLIHDGLRNPQELRRVIELPVRQMPPPTLSGHGGELAHGFYYHSNAQLRTLRRGGDSALMDRLDRAARRRHSAASPDGYALYSSECARTLAQGRAMGIKGPALLDWFYLAQRLPYRSGLGAREGRYSACATPGFIRAAFDLRPRDRLSAKLHRSVIARLVPAWKDVPFFRAESAAMPAIRRRRIWERPREAEELSELIANGGAWTQIFEATRIREMWNEVSAGRGSADYEHVFYRLVWREAFEQHLRALHEG